MNSTKIKLPKPYDKQIEIIKHPAKRKVICAGRRAGKTVMAGLMAVEAFLDGKRVLLSSTSQEQADVFWDYIRSWLWPLREGNMMYKNEVRRIMQLGEGQLRVKTGRNPDALRSDHADLLILDECARLEPIAWQMVGAPMLADSGGSAVFISTPLRKNWFFELYNKGLGDDPNWKSWQFASTHNPHLDQVALKQLTEDMSQDAYEQEILAKFLEGSGAVFRAVEDVCVLPRATPYHSAFVMGVDWAMTNDYTVLAVMDMNTGEMVDMDRFKGVSWSLQRGRVMSLYNKWRPVAVHAEANSIGSPNIEALQQENVPVVPFQTTAATKPRLIEGLALAIERQDVKLLDDPHLKNELMAYEKSITMYGRSTYSAPSGMHDDTVIATALAWHGCNEHQIRWIGSF